MSVNKKIHEADLYISSGAVTDEDKNIITAFLKARKLSIYKKARHKKSVKLKAKNA